MNGGKALAFLVLTFLVTLTIPLLFQRIGAFELKGETTVGDPVIIAVFSTVAVMCCWIAVLKTRLRRLREQGQQDSSN